MVTSDQLLPLIMQLQRGGTIAQGRRKLLKYIRKASGAQLAALFALDKDMQCLSLLAYSGRRPPYSVRPAPSSRSWSAEDGTRRLIVKRISADGLFGSALLTRGLLHIPDLDSDQRILQEERSWGWPGGSAILSAINTGDQSGGEQGVLVLCFDPHADSTGRSMRRCDASTEESESDLRICIALLASYLSDKDHSGSPSLPLLRRSVPTDIDHDEEEKQGIADLLPPQHVQQCTFPEMMYSLSC
ncbi:MAG: hypothetical protein JOZ18_09330, partial [Chloroflexi bacterium]|nr:hypothetical protein [Chloroflexota bacterium]